MPTSAIHPPTLCGRSIRLRPIADSDFGFIHALYSDPTTAFLWSAQRRILSDPEFVDFFQDHLRHFIDVGFIIERLRASPDPRVGLIYAYNLDLVNGHVFITTVLDRRRAFLGLGAQAVFLLVDYLFAYFPLHKVYFDVLACNSLSIKTCLTAGFSQEGTFREHIFFNGQRTDLLRFALYRSGWPRIRQRFTRAFAARDS